MNTKTPPAQPGTSRHTPGPWHWLPNDGCFIMAANGETVAEIPCQGCNKANGPLLASAPVMLEALKEAQAFIASARHRFPKSIKHRDTFQLNLASAAIGDAIAQAEGRA